MMKKKRKFVAITTLIDKDIVISGDTSYTGGIRIDGKMIGNLKVHGEEDSLLIMGHGSKITGDVDVEKAIINGEINGNIKCHDYLELNTNSIVNGSIEYDIIEVQEGAKITGDLKFIKNNKKTEPKKNIKQKFQNKLKKLITKKI
jgi:cytoskeletal protein CcmA (bactofilin family)|tara:strand:+ start:166 stop:600 length:435 start_codon:yes stop_codon:yes gene_type:complete